MLIVILLTTLAWQRASALPISTGPLTSPTLIHNVIFGVFARTSCSDVRSMYEIVRSCFFTIAACVYRAIHPNVPDPNASLWKKATVTVKITFYALIAPELMIWWALRQRFGADIVVAEVNKIRPELKWTQTHGQFAQMGGFGRKDDKKILHPPTLIKLLQEGQIDVEELQLTKKEINDKSKGDILSKGLIAFQTTWFMFECLARLQQGLPIIELEVVTLAFSTLNAITYGLWWYKPLNVVCPIYLHILPSPSKDSSHSEWTSVENGSQEEEPLFGGDADGVESPRAQGDPIVKENGVVRDTLSMVLDALNGVVDVIKQDLRAEGWFWTVAKWLIIVPFLAILWPLNDLLEDEEVAPAATHVTTFYAMEIPDGKFDWVMILSSVIGMVFGAIHFISWNSTFPTHIQLLLWRASSIIMVIQPFLILLTRLCRILYTRAPSGSFQEVIAESLRRLFAFISFSGGMIPYVGARFCILVLAFLTLRELPLESFTNVSWTTYIPHF